MSVIVGCDPGMNGAIATVVDGELLDVADMPTITIERRSKGKTRRIRSVDRDEVARIIKNARHHCPPHETPIVVVEQVQAFNGEAAGGAFRFGGCFECLCTVPVTLGWVLNVVRPQIWKPAVGLPVGSDKDASRELAAAIYPAMAGEFSRTKDDGRADAALLAHWQGVGR